MTVKEMNMIRNALCKAYDKCSNCPLGDVDACDLISLLADWLTPEKEKELKNWYHENVNTYIKDFCKKFPNANMDYVVNNICVDMVYRGFECSDCEGTVDGCVTHWNSPMENDNV